MSRGLPGPFMSRVPSSRRLCKEIVEHPTSAICAAPFWPGHQSLCFAGSRLLGEFAGGPPHEADGDFQFGMGPPEGSARR